MPKNIFLRVALPTPLRRLFDYLPPQGVDLTRFIPGVRVQVPFQTRTLVGVLIDWATESSVPHAKLKRVITLLDDTPVLPADVYQLCQWAADYYHAALGEVLTAAMPTLLRKGKPMQASNKPEMEKVVKELPHELNPAQANAVAAISKAQQQFRVFLLDGVTGSGKTEVYLQTIAKVLENNQQVLVLVPEISLTPQTIARFRARFAVPIVSLHSSLSEKERLQAWLAARAGIAKIVIGTRSSAFTAFANLGLIVVDEEHDQSFKQQDRFRYHARDVAIKRASLLQIPIILGSATPSLETLHNTKQNRYTYLSLPVRAGKAVLPNYEMVDVRHLFLQEGLSPILLQAMTEQLNNNNQVLLFLNRRGYAPVLYCLDCQVIVNCERCDAHMVYHQTPLRLHCHHCDAKRAVPKKCQKCGQTNLQTIGLGTQRIEQTLAKLFPTIPIIRVDRDNTRRKGAMQELLTQINQQNKAILLGTQMLAKGHHFPNVTLVGIVDADSGLMSADFRAAEQMGQLLLQVGGRAGREEKPGKVLIQTRHAHHPLLHSLIQGNYHAFSQLLLTERELTTMPPYAYFALLRVESYEEEKANHFLLQVKQLPDIPNTITLLGPVPAVIKKRKGLYCYQLLMKALKRQTIQHFLKMNLLHIETMAQGLSVKWVLDIDPMGFI